MRAIVIDRFGGPEVLTIKELPVPEPLPGQVTIQVKAFGVNHAETHMRKGEWDEWQPVSGIECVGVVHACPGGEFDAGTTVAAVMGGMGRVIPGSYAEYTRVAATNVIALDSKLPWEQLAALPETYTVAWSCLFNILGLQKGQSILIRGATSCLGRAAVHLAVSAGASVTATTRRRDRASQLTAIGAFEAEIEGSDFASKHQNPDTKFDRVLNLVGNSVLLESLGMVRRGGRLCQAGWLGGLQPLVDFNPMVQMASGVHFSLFHSKVLGTEDFPLEEVPLQQIVKQIETGEWDAKPAQVFDFEDIQAAHRAMDAGQANGKVVVRISA